MGLVIAIGLSLAGVRGVDDDVAQQLSAILDRARGWYAEKPPVDVGTEPAYAVGLVVVHHLQGQVVTGVAPRLGAGAVDQGAQSQVRVGLPVDKGAHLVGVRRAGLQVDADLLGQGVTGGGNSGLHFIAALKRAAVRVRGGIPLADSGNEGMVLPRSGAASMMVIA